jgi:nucleotide-binding universal stress UspA family protein
MGQHVLVPVDGSPQAETALEHVLDTMPEPTITLLHVINPVSSFGYGDDEYFDFDSYQADATRNRERGEAMLEKYRTTVTERDIAVETVLRTGKPAREILATVEAADIDQIVMGSRGRSGIGRVLFGSVAEEVTRRATVPVTIVR